MRPFPAERKAASRRKPVAGVLTSPSVAYLTSSTVFPPGEYSDMPISRVTQKNSMG